MTCRGATLAVSAGVRGRQASRGRRGCMGGFSRGVSREGEEHCREPARGRGWRAGGGVPIPTTHPFLPARCPHLAEISQIPFDLGPGCLISSMLILLSARSEERRVGK